MPGGLAPTVHEVHAVRNCWDAIATSPAPDIGSEANAWGGKCQRQHEGMARDRAIRETPYRQTRVCRDCWLAPYRNHGVSSRPPGAHTRSSGASGWQRPGLRARSVATA